MTIYYESELYHYGVPGMKWGHRKARTWDGGQTRTGAYARAMRGSVNRYSRRADRFQKRADNAVAGSKRAIKNQYKADVARVAAKTMNNRAKAYDKMDRQIKDYRQSQGRLKSVAKAGVLNNRARDAYDLARSDNKSRGKAALEALKAGHTGFNSSEERVINKTANSYAAQKKQLKARYKFDRKNSNKSIGRL